MIRCCLVAIAIFTAIFAYNTTTYAIEGYPGSTWGEVRQDIPNNSSSDTPSNLLGQGYIEQGIDWTKWGNLFLNSYATVRYKFDTAQYDYNNSVGPGLGFSLNYIAKNGSYLRLGVEHNWETFYTNGKTDEKTIIYGRWFQWWNLKN